MRALVIGASGGIGAALVDRLRGQGTDVVGLSRSVDQLDITDESSVERSLATLKGAFDFILVTTGALEINGAEPEKSLRSIDIAGLTAQFTVNAVGPALVLKHCHRLLPRQKRAVIAVLSARVGSIGDNRLGGWYSYRAAKAALNQIIRTASIELARSHPQLVCVALHPGTVATAFTERYLGRHPSVPPAEAAMNLLSLIERLDSSQTGEFFDWAGKSIAW